AELCTVRPEGAHRLICPPDALMDGPTLRPCGVWTPCPSTSLSVSSLLPCLAATTPTAYRRRRHRRREAALRPLSPPPAPVGGRHSATAKPRSAPRQSPPWQRSCRRIARSMTCP